MRVGHLVKPGDIVVWAGEPHLIASVTEHIARAADGWGISLDKDGRLRIPAPNDRWCVIPGGQS